ncbi:MAG: PspC domain-containing protein [Clostridia bacterium]|nr:PspC domain-containing protein [Clostridia bacterium]
MERRLLRKSRDKVMGGLCSGLADYIGAEPTIVRLVALFGIIASGVFPGLFLYLICLIIIPSDAHMDSSYYGDNTSSCDPGYKSYDPSSSNGRYVLGILLIVIGVFLFARMFFGWIDFKYVFAGLMVLGGLYMLFGSRRDQ